MLAWVVQKLLSQSGIRHIALHVCHEQESINNCAQALLHMDRHGLDSPQARLATSKGVELQQQ